MSPSKRRYRSRFRFLANTQRDAQYDRAAARDDGKNDARKVVAVPGARQIQRAYLDGDLYQRRRIELFKPAA